MHTYIHTHIHTYTHTHTHIHTYTHIYIYTYIHTYIHTYRDRKYSYNNVYTVGLETSKLAKIVRANVTHVGEISSVHTAFVGKQNGRGHQADLGVRIKMDLRGTGCEHVD
jgi:hypothetical protein